MHSIVTTFRGAVIKVEVANFGAAMDTLIDQDGCITDCKGSDTTWELRMIWTLTVATRPITRQIANEVQWSLEFFFKKGPPFTRTTATEQT